ncbi:MAG: tetratricopeptide repeat protein [Planctomycetota bacterium]|jgi:tetratricopeptide (TPR) repeat protein
MLGVAFCAAILGLFIMRSFWHASNGSGKAAQQAQQVVKTPIAGGKNSSQHPAELSRTPAAGLISAVEGQYTQENLEQETIAVLNRLVGDFPERADPLGLLGDIYVELGKTAEAMKCWEKCAELEPERAGSYERMAYTAVEKGEFERAVAIAHKALKIDPEMPGIHSQLGRALRGLGKPTESLAALEKAVMISPKKAENHYLLGQAYQQLQQYEQSKQSYMIALQINPDYTDACYGIATASARLGHKEEAASYRKKFEEMKARDWRTVSDKRDYLLNQRFLVMSRRRAAKTHTNAGILYYDRGQWQAAEKHWLRAVELDPGNIVCRENLADFYQKNGRNKEALQMCEQLIRIAPKNPQYHMCAGTLLTRMNRIEDALLAVKQAINLEPNNESFRRIYDQIQMRR